MMASIKYIGFYELSELKYKRMSAHSAIQKMDYIIATLNELGYSVNLISPSWIKGKGCSKEIKISNSQNNYVFAPSIGSTNKLTTYISILISYLWLVYQLLFFTKKNEKIIVYHSPWLSIPVLLAKKIKKLDVILELEEIYQDVNSISSIFDYYELKIIRSVKFFILSTDLLINKVSKNSKYIVLYGNYAEYPKLAHPIDDGKIHLLYAGIIDEEKAGAFNALEATRYLDEKYVLHILGFGNIDLLQKKIKQMEKFTDCKTKYEGIKMGDEFIKFSQTCHIGLSTQTTEGDYNNTSFPSKILTYLGMGLQVVSCDIKVVREANISSLIRFYNKTPKNLANVIKNINPIELMTSHNKGFLKNLDEQFKNSLQKLILG